MSAILPTLRRAVWKDRICIVLLVLLVIASALVPGCIRVLQQSAGSGSPNTTASLLQNVKETPGVSPAPVRIPAIPVSPSPTAQGPTSPGLVADAPPILPPDPYPVLHGVRINDTPEQNHLARPPEFTRTYTLNWNATGMIVNVVKGPLVIAFDVDPLYDCLDTPESCRGTNEVPVNRPWMVITVRDNQTRTILAEDGYAREYSSQQDNRTITIYGEGQYHITLTGAALHVTFSLTTGAAPAASVTQSAAPTSSKTSALPPEVLRRIRQGG